MPTTVRRCKAQPGQRLRRPLGAQERVEQLEQLIGAPPQAPEELAAEPIQLPHRPALVSPADPVHTVPHGHRRSPWSVATRRIQRWPPSCQARNHAAVTHRRQGLNDKLREDSASATSTRSRNWTLATPSSSPTLPSLQAAGLQRALTDYLGTT